MIQKKNIGLVIDSNILNEIVVTDYGNIRTVLTSWIYSITEDMQDLVKGKIITFFVSPEIIKEYETSLSKKKHKNICKNLKYIMRKSGGIIKHESNRNGIGISFKKYNISHSNRRKNIDDKDDEKFLILVEKILEKNNWRDRAIIFASKDRRSMPQIKKALVLQRGRIKFAEDMKSLKEVIRC